MARCMAFLGIACAGFAMVAVQAAAGGAEPGCESAGVCSPSEDAEDLEASVLLQSAPALAATAGHFGCSKRSLVIGQEVGVDTYLQWNLELVRNGADFFEFLNLTKTGYRDELRFETDVDFVKHGRPQFGIIHIKFPNIGGKDLNLTRRDALLLKEYVDAGGMLVVGEGDAEPVNQLMIDLDSSIRQVPKPNPENMFPCSTPENAPYVPSKNKGACPLTKGVTGLQGSNLDEVVDPEDSSYPLFHLAGNEDFVVGRVEKTRNLVVVGDDEPFDDDCVRRDEDNRLAFGPTTNLRFFANLWADRCRDNR